jgi:hypothetical protein
MPLRPLRVPGTFAAAEIPPGRRGRRPAVAPMLPSLLRTVIFLFTLAAPFVAPLLIR